MIVAAQTVLFALFVWYFSTGAILLLDGLPARSYRWSMAAASAVLAASLYGMAALRDDITPAGAYAGFACGVAAWGWQEMAFLMGFATGPRRLGCTQTGWRHFRNAVAAILYHELAIVAGAALVVTASWGGSNHVGLWTFMILWGMRLSAKLNMFLGVRNLTIEFLPPHLAFIQSYLHCKPMNLLFPASVTGGTVLTVLLIQAAASGAPFGATGLTLLATMAVLGLAEHWFLMLPVPFARLWHWGLRSRQWRLPHFVKAEPVGAVQSKPRRRPWPLVPEATP